MNLQSLLARPSLLSTLTDGELVQLVDAYSLLPETSPPAHLQCRNLAKLAVSILEQRRVSRTQEAQDIRMEDRHRQMRNISAFAAVAAIISALVGVYSAYSAFQSARLFQLNVKTEESKNSSQLK